jgi:hypothetical protein
MRSLHNNGHVALGHPNFCNELLQELHQAKLIDKLLPALTQGDACTQDLLLLLQQTNLVSPNAQQELNQQQKNPPVRGDKSLFLSRDCRSRPNFSARHPQLHLLISTMSKTLQEQLSNAIDLDLNQTLVRLAVCPGDGSSCHVRHCDRGQDGCTEESSLKNKSASPQRIVTAICCLTDLDWSERKDGGSLLAFSHDDNSVAVPHCRDRLIVFRSDGVELQVLPSLRRRGQRRRSLEAKRSSQMDQERRVMLKKAQSMIRVSHTCICCRTLIADCCRTIFIPKHVTAQFFLVSGKNL